MHEAAGALSPLVCVTVLVPTAVEERVVDWLLTHPDWRIEFSAHPVAARGPFVRLALNEEQVQGYAQRVELKLIVERSQLDALVGQIKTLLPGIDGGFWVLPIERLEGFSSATGGPGGPQ
jgi:hypothetical protein